MSRRTWLALAGTGAAGATGLGLWTWFLAGQSLEVMDQWSSVLSSFGTLASLLLAILGLILAGRNAPPASSSSNRAFRAHNAHQAQVTFGDNSPITDRNP